MNNLQNNLVPNDFYKPYKDNTGKIDLMRYCNSGISYGYNIENDIFYVCDSPILECTILRAVKQFKTFAEAREYFFEYRNYYKN
jgi:hypothetical protein